LINTELILTHLVPKFIMKILPREMITRNYKARTYIARV
jgi:hypothetical protein